MSYSPKQLRAIRWYAERENITPQLSAFPMVRFKKPDGTFVEENIRHLTDWYDGRRQAAKRESRRKGKQTGLFS